MPSRPQSTARPSSRSNIQSDADDRRRRSRLLDQQGSRSIFGNLLLIPIEESLLYVRPLYIEAEGQTAVPAAAPGDRGLRRPRS